MTLNKVIIIGRLGSQPESKTFSNGRKVVNLTVATSEGYKNKEGDWQDKTEWHKVQVGIPTLVESSEKYLSKGDLVQIEGKLRHESYQNDGKTNYFTFVDANLVKRLAKTKQAESQKEIVKDDFDPELGF